MRFKDLLVILVSIVVFLLLLHIVVTNVVGFLIFLLIFLIVSIIVIGVMIKWSSNTCIAKIVFEPTISLASCSFSFSFS